MFTVSLHRPTSFIRRFSSPQGPYDLNNWKQHEFMLYYEAPDCKPSSKIAAFGFNKALATTSIFKSGPDAWTMRYAEIPDKLRKLHEEGFKLVIFTNHSSIGKARTVVTRERATIQQTGRCAGLITLLGLPFQVFISTARAPDKKNPEIDFYRKPNPGMWHFMVEHCNAGITPDMEASFYVGGAAGRTVVPKGRNPDHSDYDILFAQNVGIPFFTDDDYFDMNTKLPGPPLKKIPLPAQQE
eukprot:TRINITY_DN1328_c0_g1_i3.p1 TRINITY_DN1328_c0_g1~~TRINITY_DN1328_c0_g1_i3.p1  ORF type:complete len:241 (+),score=43.67 TRINITY_DN1328_c0_g1_i3:71-793(+)